MRIFSEVEKQTGFVFLYSREVLANTRPVSIKADHLPLTSFLDEVFKGQPIEYTIRSKSVFISLRNTTERSDRSADNINPALFLDTLGKITGKVMNEQGEPLISATIRVKGKNTIVRSNDQGVFEINALNGTVLIISYIGYETLERKVNGSEMEIFLKYAENKLEDVEVSVNTGYQKLKANEMVGSVDIVSENMLKEQVGSNILDRLKGMTTALQFVNKTPASSIVGGNPRSVLGMSVRGWSTINGPTDPLIVVDNFPYQGSIDNIDPNDVESIVLLKDAAAASVWGARAANGVIVINTRRGKFNQKTNIRLGTTLILKEKPRLSQLPLMSTSSFIDLELAEWSRIQQDQSILPTPNTPVADVIMARRQNLISEADSAARIDYLRSVDSREEWNKHIYVTPFSQQYSINLTGGSSNISWKAGGSHIRDLMVNQATSDRTTFNFNNNFKVTPKLELQVGVEYVTANSKTGAPGFNTVTAKNGNLDVTLPYMQLADKDGNPVAVLNRFSQAVLDTLGDGMLLDYNYYPLTDWRHDYESKKRNSLILNAIVAYRPTPDLVLNMSFQTQKEMNELTDMSERESYYTRDIINSFSILNRSNKVVTRQVPLGDIVSFMNIDQTSYNLRAQASYIKRFGRHQVNLMAGADVSQYLRKIGSNLMVGYNEDPLYQAVVDFNSTFEQMPLSDGRSLGSRLWVSEVYRKSMLEERLVAATASATYIYDSKYVLYTSLRREGANILGVATNDRWKPFWSAGASWAIHKEKFMQFAWIDRFNFRTSVGILGNVDITRTSNAVASASSGDPFPYLVVATPPNPNLRWEKTMTINWALDVSILESRINATIEYYIKRGRDLYGDILADFTQSPAQRIKANASAMDGRGWDINLRTKNLTGKFAWNTSIRWSRATTKIVNYLNQPITTSNALYGSSGDGNQISTGTLIFAGDELYAIRALRSAGLNNQGQLQYLVDGKPTTNVNDAVNDIVSNEANASVLKYFGSSAPTFFGSITNYFTWNRLTLLVQMQYNLGFYFKKSTVSNQFYAYHKDWESRWQQPGDELHTTIPAYDFNPASSNLQYSYYPLTTDIVRRGDHVRLDNMQLAYDLPIKQKLAGIQSVNISINASNLGIVWRANKEKLDPMYEAGYLTYGRPDKIWSLTLNALF